MLDKTALTKKVGKNTLCFTVIELLIVVTIIGVLIVFSVLFVPVQLQKSRDAVRKGNLSLMKKGVDEYYQDENCYPQSVPVCGLPLINGSLVINDSLPCDPLNKLSYVYVPEISDCPQSYQLYTNLEYLEDEVIDKVGCRDGCGPECKYNYGVSSENSLLDPYCGGGAPLPPTGGTYVCAPGNNNCEVYLDPLKSGCPNIYLDDPTCQGDCVDPTKRCHDASGK